MWEYLKDPEANRMADGYIAKHYHHFLQMSGFYLKMDEKNRIFSILQLIIYVFILAYHLVIFLKSAIAIYGINMVLFSQNFHFCLLLQDSLIVLLSCVSNHFKIFLILRLASYDFYDYQEPAVNGEELLRSTMRTERRRLALMPIGVVLASGVVLSVSAIVDSKAGSFDFNSTASMFDYHLPLSYTKNPFYAEDGIGYYFAALGQLSLGYILSAIAGAGGYSFIHISENVILQLKILNNSLDNIESRIEHLHSQLFGKMNRNSLKSLRHDSRYAYCYTKCLRKNFEHHQVILKAFHLLEDVVSIPLACSYFVGTIVIALSLISAGSVNELPGTFVSSIMLCAVEVGYMFLYSAIGQRFIDLSTELRYKMYNTRWYMCSEEVKSSLMIFQEMTLKPLTMTVGWVIPANMETFTWVMKSAYSSYNLVNAIALE